MDGASQLGLILELGYNWVPHFDTRQGGTMLARLTSLRRKIGEQLRKEIRPIHVRDNHSLRPDGFRFLSDGFVYEKGWLPADYLLVSDPGDREHELVAAEPYPGFFEPMLNRRFFVARREAAFEAALLGLQVHEPEDILLKYLRRALEIEALFGDTAVSDSRAVTQ